MHKSLQSMLCLTVAFVMLFFTAAAADTLNNVSVLAASLSSDHPSLNGMVRVYLSSLGSPSSLTLTVSGSYSLSNGTSLANGEMLTVSINSSTGAITLTRGGTTYNMGSNFTLRRHSTTGSNGIKIAQARRPGNLYPGDIQFKAVSRSGGGYKLYTIAHIYIENYLYGVVPYEMGSSAPLESLKAQAVAARTYTVRMMHNRSSWSYDVVDTTGDQTYNGTPTSVTNCKTAVDATKGIVLKNGSSYTATYYSASNGGQTESIRNAWGTSGYSYLGVKDDPFDYANPSSIVKKTTVYADAGNYNNNASLLSLLRTKAAAALQLAGYNASTSNTTIKTIKDISPHTAKYASPSRLYTKMDFILSVGTYSTSNVYSTVTTTVTCDIFHELENLLGMSIQSTDNELWTVETTNAGFSIQARRYGHGLGMSQRGAMYMGQLGYTYDEILGFYFDGSSRIGCTFRNTILAADSSEQISTDENPADTDDGSIRGTVSLSSGSKLAVRNAKSTSAAVLTVLSNGTSVTVLSDDGTWCLIKFGSITGYVPTNTLRISGTPAESDDTDVSTIDGFAVVTANGYLNLRESGNYSASILSTAPSGAILTVISWNTPWAYIQYGTIAAYASSDYLSFSSSYPEDIQDMPDPGDTPTDPEDPSDPETIKAVVATQSGSLNMRQFAQAGSAIRTTIPKGTTVTVTSRGATWSGVTYLGMEGYVMTMFLSFLDDTSDTPSDPSQTSGMQAMVATESGSLNLRQLPKSGSSIFCTIPRLEIITVNEKGAEWCQVTYAGITGYVMSVFLSFIENPEDPGDNADEDNPDGDEDPGDSDADQTATAVVTTESGSLNMRSEGIYNSKVLTCIPKGTTIPVLQRLPSWTYTCYQEYYGYVMNSFLTFSSENTDTGNEGAPVSATVVTESGSLNMRTEPYGKVLTQIPRHATLSVYKQGSAWCYVLYNNIYGYVMTSFLSIEENAGDMPATTEPPADTPPDETDNPDPPAAGTAIVSVDSGSLNLRIARSDTADILTTIPNGTVIPLLIQGDDWCKTTYNAFQGYVQTAFLTIGSSVPTDTGTEDPSNNKPNETGDATYSVTAWINTTSGSLNLRETASDTAAILLQIPQHAQVKVLTDIAQTWCKASYSNITGYVMSEYLTTVQPPSQPDEGETDNPDDPAVEPETPADSPDDQSGTGDAGEEEEPALPMDSTLRKPATDIVVYVRPPAGYAALGLYEACSDACELLASMEENAEVEVTRAGNTWCEVIYGEQQGYCLRDGLSFFAD